MRGRFNGIKHKVTFYSLGNFVFEGGQYLVEVEVSQCFIKVEGGQYLVEVEGGQYLVEVEGGQYLAKLRVASIW